MKIRKITCIVLALMMALSLAACSGSSDTESSEAEAVETESTETESTQTESADIDLSAGITRTDNAETGESTVESDVFTLTLPNGASWDYEVESPERIVFYNKAAKEADLGGVLFWLEVFEGSDEELDVVPTAVVGEINGRKIVATFASDVEYDTNDTAAAEEYQEVSEAAHTISDDAATSPLVLK